MITELLDLSDLKECAKQSKKSIFRKFLCLCKFCNNISLEVLISALIGLSLSLSSFVIFYYIICNSCNLKF